MVAAAGNAGAKSPPLYPAANPNVIAVSGTDAQEKLFAASNRGNHIAIAAPGADIFLPAPDGKYQITSGTSFSAAYVSGIAALLLERNPALKPNGCAYDFDEYRPRSRRAGPRRSVRGRARPTPLRPSPPRSARRPRRLPSVKDAPVQEKSPEHDNASVSRALSEPAPSMASDKSAANDGNRPAEQ